MAQNSLKEFSSGDIVNKRYEILYRLGAGGMASVYKAKDIVIDQEVALKVAQLDNQSTLNRKTIERYQNEYVSVAKLLSNDNVVTLHNIFEENNCLFIVLECVENGTLKNRFNDFGPMTLEEIKFYFSRICCALQYSHDNSIIHRDIKPDNILINLDNEVKLGDFGIAILDENGLEAKSIIGTPKYMAPETFFKKTTNSSDIYSLGIMLYEFATGNSPFIYNSGNSNTNAATLLKMHANFKPTRPREINSKIPQELENLIMQMLEKNPFYRPKSVEEVKKRLLKINSNINTYYVKPYNYQSKFNQNNEIKEKVGLAYDFLGSRFRSKISFTLIFFLCLSVIVFIIGMVI